MRVAGIDEADPGLGEHRRQILAAIGQVGGKGVHEHQRRLAAQVGFGQGVVQAATLARADPEIGSARPGADDVEEQAAMAGDRPREGPHRLGRAVAEGGERAVLEIMVAGDRQHRQGERGQRRHDPAILVGFGVIGIVARQEDEVDPLAHRRQFGDDPLQPRDAGPAIGRIGMKVADMDPTDRAAHAAVSASWLRVPAQAGRKVPAKPIHSARLIAAKLPRM